MQYIDGVNLYMAFFCPNASDPSGLCHCDHKENVQKQFDYWLAVLKGSGDKTLYPEHTQDTWDSLADECNTARKTGKFVISTHVNSHCRGQNCDDVLTCVLVLVLRCGNDEDSYPTAVQQIILHAGCDDAEDATIPAVPRRPSKSDYNYEGVDECSDSHTSDEQDWEKEYGDGDPSTPE